MNSETLVARLEELKQMERQLMANLNAVSGAQQECQYWLELLSKPAESKADECDSIPIKGEV